MIAAVSLTSILSKIENEWLQEEYEKTKLENVSKLMHALCYSFLYIK